MRSNITIVKRIGVFGFAVGVGVCAFAASASASETDQPEPDQSEMDVLAEPTEFDQIESDQSETVSSEQPAADTELGSFVDSEDNVGETQPAESVSETLDDEPSCGEVVECLLTDQVPAEAQAGTEDTETNSELPETDNAGEVLEESSSAVVSGEFNDGKILNRDHADTTSKVDVDLDSQFYEVVLESKDETHKAGFAEDQTHERWVLDGLDVGGSTIFTTEATADLGNNQTTGSDNVGTYDFSGVASVQGRHARLGTSIDSIEPYKFTLNPTESEPSVGSPPVQVETAVFKHYERLTGTNPTTEPLDVDFDPGDYQIFLVSQDKNHPEQAEQGNEQWRLKGFDETGDLILETQPTTDLSDDETFGSSYVGTYSLSSPLVAIQGEHASMGYETNSIRPVSATFIRFNDSSTVTGKEPENGVEFEPEPEDQEFVGPIAGSTIVALVAGDSDPFDPSSGIAAFQATGSSLAAVLADILNEESSKSLSAPSDSGTFPSEGTNTVVEATVDNFFAGLSTAVVRATAASVRIEFPSAAAAARRGIETPAVLDNMPEFRLSTGEFPGGDYANVRLLLGEQIESRAYDEFILEPVRIDLEQARSRAEQAGGSPQAINVQTLLDPQVYDKETIIDEYSVLVSGLDEQWAEELLGEMASDMDGVFGGEFAELANFKNLGGEAPFEGQVIDIDVKDNLISPDFPGEAGINAPVAITTITNDKFRVITLEWNRREHGLHGTREWGFEPEGSGIRFYSRGISVPDVLLAEVGAERGERRLWSSMLDSLENIVEEDGGSTSSRREIQLDGPSGRRFRNGLIAAGFNSDGFEGFGIAGQKVQGLQQQIDYIYETDPDPFFAFALSDPYRSQIRDWGCVEEIRTGDPQNDVFYCSIGPDHYFENG